jgi:hypothetical protein
MQSSERPVDRYLSRVLEEMRDIVSLAEFDTDAGDVPADLLERLDITNAPDYPADTAWDLAASMVYSVEWLAVVESDGTMGERRSVELLLGGGGPTITLTARLRDDAVRDVELWHSWGDPAGHEATASVSNQADLDTVDAFLRLAFWVDD